MWQPAEALVALLVAYFLSPVQLAALLVAA
jgi:hypothetical protein